MALISDALARTTAGLYRVGGGLEKTLDAVARHAPRALPQPYDALVKGLVWILATVLIDFWAGKPPVLQILYLAPIWIAYETAGLGVAAFLGAFEVPVSAANAATPSWGFAWDLVVRAAIMASLLIILAYHGRRFESSQESAHRDPLTGALNRSGFEEAARESVDAALATKASLSVALIDMDAFKDLNDIKGHAFGDQVLRALVRSLNKHLEGAAIGRIGGDEFVVVDRYRSGPEVRRALGRAFDDFTDATLVLGKRATFTVGLAELGIDGMRYEGLVEAADRDMYRNKRARFGV